MTEAAARALLEGAPYRFEVAVRYVDTSSFAAGTVTETSPSVGSLVAQGETVTLQVAQASEIEVPDVRGMTEADASSALAGFSVDVEPRDLPAGHVSDGKVLTQSLTPGASAEPGTNITIEVGDAAEPPPVTTAATTTAAAATTTVAPEPTTT